MNKSTYLVTAVSLLAPSYYAGAADSRKMNSLKNAQEMEIESLDEEGLTAYLEDIVASDNPDASIALGLFRLEKGKPLEYTYGSKWP